MMRGYVIQEKGHAGEDVPVPELGPYDALVRPTAVATCTTDVHLIDSRCRCPMRSARSSATRLSASSRPPAASAPRNACTCAGAPR